MYIVLSVKDIYKKKYYCKTRQIYYLLFIIFIRYFMGL